jgi:hypothetical protein
MKGIREGKGREGKGREGKGREEKRREEKRHSVKSELRTHHPNQPPPSHLRGQ